MASIFKPPGVFPLELPIVFLAGSIDNGKATLW